MNEYEPCSEQQDKWIDDALTIAGFEPHQDFDGIWTRNCDGNRKIVVDRTAGCSVYFQEGKNRISKDDDNDTLAGISAIIVDAESGKMPTKSQPDIVHEPEPEPEPHSLPAVNEPAKLPHYINHDVQLSTEIIKKYINDKASDEEAYVFLQLCKARNLNPFLKEAYLIKYSHTDPATMVVGKDAILKRAELNPQFNGFKAGIIIQTDEAYNVYDEREGGFYTNNEKENIVGGWAEVYRKDHDYPIIIKVPISEYITIKKSTGKPNAMWANKPGTMIRKVALVQALREAFPSELSGMYDASELQVEV